MAEQEFSLSNFLGNLGDTAIQAAQDFATVQNTINGTTEPVQVTSDASASGTVNPQTESPGGPDVTGPQPIPTSPSELVQFFNRNIVPILVGVVTVLTLGGLMLVLRGK